jgi:hypothetical protein
LRPMIVWSYRCIVSLATLGSVLNPCAVCTSSDNQSGNSIPHGITPTVRETSSPLGPGLILDHIIAHTLSASFYSKFSTLVGSSTQPFLIWSAVPDISARGTVHKSHIGFSHSFAHWKPSPAFDNTQRSAVGFKCQSRPCQ